MKPSTKIAATLLLSSSTLILADTAHAQSSIVLYGMVDQALAYSSNQNGHRNFYVAGGELYANKWGMRGNEALSPTTSVIFDLQAGYTPQTGAMASSGVLFNREAFVGIKDTRYGTVTLGRQYSPYYLFVSPLTGASLATGASSAHPGDLDGLDTSIRVNDSISYTSPTFDGFSFGGMAAPGGSPGSIANGSTLSGAIRYATGPFTLAAGIVHFDNASTTAGWDSSSSGVPNKSAVDQGYFSARSLQQISVAGNYKTGAWLFGVNYSNVQFVPGNGSLFTDPQIFNVYAVLARYRFTPAFDMAGELTYETAAKANGITTPARYEQISFRETYNLSVRTMLYAIQGYTHATGQTLGADGQSDIVNAGAVVGDAQNLLPSTNHSQLLTMFGIAVIF